MRLILLLRYKMRNQGISFYELYGTRIFFRIPIPNFCIPVIIPTDHEKSSTHSYKVAALVHNPDDPNRTQTHHAHQGEHEVTSATRGR